MVILRCLLLRITDPAGRCQALLSAFLLTLMVSPAWQAPARAQTIASEEGRAIYERRCSVCHGDRGAGAVWASGSLEPPPRNFTETGRDMLPREAMIDAVASGRPGTAMTAWRSRLSPEQIAAVIDFIRSEFMPRRGPTERRRTAGAVYPGGLKGDPAKGGIFFHANCAECHGHAGDGHGRRAEMMVFKPLDFTTAKAQRAFDRARLFAAISWGVPGTTMPAWSKVLTGQQIADVAEYVHRSFLGADPTQVRPIGASSELVGSGKQIYVRHCSYCHGYTGKADTAAARVLDPKPRNLTAPPSLAHAQVVGAVGSGREGTAMPSFAKVLSEVEIKAVADYVTENLAARKGSGRYHTPENGWPDHDQRYGSAVPFALGELSVDAPPSSLSADERKGLGLFKGACISCHFGRRKGAAGAVLAQKNHPPTDYEKGPHDVVPEIAGLTAVELAGRRLYQAACAQCHAADGTGKNWIGRFLDPSPPDFTAAGFQALLSSGRFVERTLQPPDNTSMPSFENVLSHKDAEAIAAYARRAFQPQ